MAFIQKMCLNVHKRKQATQGQSSVVFSIAIASEQKCHSGERAHGNLFLFVIFRLEVISFIIKFKFDWINQLSVCICVKLQLCFSGVIYSCHGCHGDGNSSVRQFYRDFSRAPLMLLLLPQTQCLLSLSNWKQCCKKQKSGENSNLWTYLFKCGMNSH